MISLTLSVCLSVYLSSTYLSTNFISIYPSLLFIPWSGDPSPIELRYEHFCRQLSSLVSLPFFTSRSLFLSFLFPPDFLFFAIPFSFLFHFFFIPSHLLHFTLKLWLYLNWRDGLFTLINVLVDLTFTQLLFSR